MMIKVKSYKTLSFQAIALFFLMAISASDCTVSAKPVTKKSNSGTSPLTFYRQRNSLSNIDFFFTNKGILFNNDAVAGCNWPRGSVNSYIFGGGLWFATKKNIGGKKKKLCELGYNPNSGAGWFSDGEVNPPTGSTEGQYISYVSPHYDKATGKYNNATPSAAEPAPHPAWPVWDTSATKTLNRNYYFGDYIADVAYRDKLSDLARSASPLPNGKIPKPAMLSQEDIVNIYTDQDVSQNPEYKAATGYPFGLNVVEVIYSWSFGKYRDMMFVRRKVTNASADSLTECFLSNSFDPDLGVGGSAAANDANSYFGSTPADLADCQRLFPKTSPYYSDPTALNMARQWSKTESSAQPAGEYGCIGFTFLESPVTTPNGNIVDISDSDAVGGYCSGLKQLGLKTFRQWTITNDPPTADLRYDFLADGSRDHDISIYADMRLLFSTGPFTLPPGKSVETTMGIGIARPSTTTLKLNQDSVIKLIAFAHQVFADTTGTYSQDSNGCSVTVKHFVTPVPPDIPNITTTCLDRGVLVQWDYKSDSTKDPLSTTLPFLSYDLYRTTRSDHDSTIRPTGINPIIHLGTWSLFDFRKDTVYHLDTVKVGTTKTITKTFSGFHYTRISQTPNKIPHSFLDYGDDNQDGVLSGNEGLYNGVKYYYFITATDEFDSLNNVGPLTTAVVNNKNFAVGIPCKPVFPDLPTKIAGDSGCLNGALAVDGTMKASAGARVSLEVQDTGKFLQIYSNDVVNVSFQPRWTEYNARYLYQSPLNIYVDVTEQKLGKDLTYDKLYNPNANPVYTPYSFPSGLVQQVLGQRPADTNVSGHFTTNNSKFAPFQTVDQAFDILVDFEFKQLKAPYRLTGISVDPAKAGLVHLSQRTGSAPTNVQITLPNSNIDTGYTRPSFLGSLGEDTYEITFGPLQDWAEDQYDPSTGKVIYGLDHIRDTSSNANFRPKAMKMTVKSVAHCNAELAVIRPGQKNDVVVEYDPRFYGKSQANGQPNFTIPDTMTVPLPGKFAVDAFHYIEDSHGDISTANPIYTTVGQYYFPDDQANQNSGKFLATVHRIRLGGAEIILNYPGITAAVQAGDTSAESGLPAGSDFQPGDKITVTFTGLMKGLPFPGAKFAIQTSKDKKIDFTDNELYKQSRILSEVQVVPNPYIVEHIGQASTDNSKLFFTRLPPRATIEIYSVAGELVKTLEHNGYAYSVDANQNKQYDYSSLADRYNVEEWNLLSEGRQRVGSQVFVARIIAKDPKDNSVLGETTTKFAVVLGGYRLVR
ncbi:MAG: hypothetical protein WCH46_09985 [bacterium]